MDKDNPIFTSNKYSKGKAIYTGHPGRGKNLGALVDDLISELAVRKGQMNLPVYWLGR